MINKTEQTTPMRKGRSIAEAIAAYAAFVAISFSSRFVPAIFLLVVINGIAFPLIWAKVTRGWSYIGFTLLNLRRAVIW